MKPGRDELLHKEKNINSLHAVTRTLNVGFALSGTVSLGPFVLNSTGMSPDKSGTFTKGDRFISA